MLRVLPLILMPRFEYFVTLFPVNIITTVLSSFILNPHLLHHLLIALICFCSSRNIKVRFLPDLHTALSSAYNEHIVLSSLTDGNMSLIIKRNKIGEVYHFGVEIFVTTYFLLSPLSCDLLRNRLSSYKYYPLFPFSAI